MAIKKRAKIVDQAEVLADELADRTYGASNHASQNVTDDFVITSISIPRSMLHQLEDKALANKRNGIEPKNTSALIRLAVSKLLTNS